MDRYLSRWQTGRSNKKDGTHASRNVCGNRDPIPQCRPQRLEEFRNVRSIRRPDDVVPIPLFPNELPIKRNRRKPIRRSPSFDRLCELFSVRNGCDEVRKVLRSFPATDC